MMSESIPALQRVVIQYALLTLLVVAPGASAEVVLRVAWGAEVPIAELQEAVQEGHALQKRINPDVRHELWVDAIHGDNTGGASLLVFYRDLTHYAEAVEKEEADEKWQSFIEDFQRRFRATYVGLMDVIVDDEAPRAEPGQVLSILVFELNDGVDGLAESVRRAAEIHAEAGTDSPPELVTPIISGDSVGTATVLHRYASLKQYAAAESALEASDEWQAFLDEFPVERYLLAYRGLSRSVDID